LRQIKIGAPVFRAAETGRFDTDKSKAAFTLLALRAYAELVGRKAILTIRKQCPIDAALEVYEIDRVALAVRKAIAWYAQPMAGRCRKPAATLPDRAGVVVVAVATTVTLVARTVVKTYLARLVDAKHHLPKSMRCSVTEPSPQIRASGDGVPIASIENIVNSLFTSLPNAVSRPQPSAA
jgi:hypothetical protein